MRARRLRFLIIDFALWRSRRLRRRADAWSTAVDWASGRGRLRDLFRAKRIQQWAGDYEVTEHGALSEPLIFVPKV